MEPQDYAAQQAALSTSMLNYSLSFARFFSGPLLSIKDWLQLLGLIFPHVQQSRQQASTLARKFYDFQRATEHPQLPLNDRPLEGTTFEDFVKNMEPARKVMSQEDSPEHARATFGLRVVREVENAGRQQIIHAVQNDPEPKIIRGWARVATGRETCAWCLMLVSRGPVYMGATTAGLDLNDTSAQRMIASGTDVSEFMEEWHDGCDCIVVPVFKQEGWFGQEAADQALDLWNDASREANRIQDEDPTIHPSGKNKGKPMTLNQEALNALRRRLDSGDITASDFAALAA